MSLQKMEQRSGEGRQAANESPAGLGVLDKAMALMTIVSDSPSAMSFTDLMRRSGLPKATLHRILATLTREGLLRLDAYTKTYRLGFRLLELAHEVWSDFDLRLSAQDELIKLRNETGAAVQLGVLDRTSVILIAAEEVLRQGIPPSQVGARVNLQASALGKAILAYLSKSRQAELIESSTDPLDTVSTTARDSFLSELDLIRARGYSLEITDSGDLVSGIGAPIFDIEGTPVGAICIRPSRMSISRAHSLSSTVIASARRISHNAGGQFMSINPRDVPIEEPDIAISCVVDDRALLGEGPIWSPRDDCLYWVDILTPSVHTFSPTEGKNESVKLGTMVSVALPRASGGLLLATPTGLKSFDPVNNQLTMFCHPEAGRPANRYNDGKCDRRGRLWIGSIDMATAANRGSLFRVDSDASWKKMDTGFTVANGMAWSPDDKSMYFVDSTRRTVYVYDFDIRSGELANRRALITLEPSDGVPDGITVDDKGCIWVAVWDAWRVSQYSPEGREMLRIRMPVPRPTSVCFGGPNLDVLYVTSASVRLTAELLEKAPQSGGLFAMQIPGVRGLPETPFLG